MVNQVGERIKSVAFIKLDEQYRRYKLPLDAAIAQVLQHGRYVNGPEITQLEQQLADFVGVKHCVAVSSGTTALQLILMSLDLQPGDEVIMPNFSFFATAEVVLLLGLRPVFVDIDARTYNVDPQAVARAITPKTRVIMPVSLYGQCAAMPQLEQLAAQHNLFLLEDAAQSMGASHLGRRSCSFGHAAATSFFPSKPLGAYGDGGACFTNDDQLAERLRLVRCHGESARYTHTVLGMNARMATIQAAVLLTKLEFFAQELALREQHAQYYNELLKGVVAIPYKDQDSTLHAYAQYTIAVEDREQVAAKLKAMGVPTAVHYPQPMHRQPLMQEKYPQYVAEVATPVTDKAATQVLSLPFGPWITPQEQEFVVAALQAALGSK